MQTDRWIQPLFLPADISLLHELAARIPVRLPDFTVTIGSADSVPFCVCRALQNPHLSCVVLVNSSPTTRSHCRAAAQGSKSESPQTSKISVPKKKTQTTWGITSWEIPVSSPAKQNPAQCLRRAGRSQHCDSSGSANPGISRAFCGCRSCRSRAWLLGWAQELCTAVSVLQGPAPGRAAPGLAAAGAAQEEQHKDRKGGSRTELGQAEHHAALCAADLWVLGWLQWEQGGDSSPVARQHHSQALPFVCHWSALRNTGVPS